MTRNAAGRLGLCLLVFAASGLAGPAVPRNGLSLTIRLGLKDKAPSRWDGRLGLSVGKVLAIEARAPKQARVEGARWKVSSRQQQARRRGRAAMVHPVLVATLDAPEDARATIATPRGELSFRIGDLAVGTPASFLDGQVAVVRWPFSCRLAASPDEEDWPAAARGSDGSVWAVYMAYRHGPPLDVAAIHEKRDFSTLVPNGNGDQVRLLRFDGKTWGEPINITEGGLDLWRPAVAVAGDGMVWVFWSQNVGGNWDLFARSYDPKAGKLGEALRLTSEPGADVYAVAATNTRTGVVAVAWQGWRDGAFDILALALEGGKPGKELRLTKTPANEWCPAIAFDSKGNMHVAFDTYEKGDYDVKVATVGADGTVRTTALATTPRLEARPTIAVDAQDRLWVAYEVGSLNWGKDWGTLWPGPRGSRLYLERDVAVRCLSGGRVLAPGQPVPVEPVRAGYPRGSVPPKRRIALPRVAFDGAGRLWLLYRRHATTAGQGERWATFATCLTSNGWARPFELPNSANLLDNRPAPVASRDALLVVHSTDYRTVGTRSGLQNDLFCSVLRGRSKASLSPLVSVERQEEKASPVHPNEAEDVRRVRAYRATVGGKTYRILRGEFHRHTELTSHQDMDGTLEEMWRYALDAAAMDWIGNGDHDNGYGKEYLWWLVQKQTDIFHHPPVFMPMFTYERSVSYPSGHRNAMFARRGIRPLPRIPGGREKLFGTPQKGSPDVKTFYAYLKRFGGICASHTSGTGMGTDWRDNDPEVEPVVEIYQGCRNSYEHEGAPAAVNNSPQCRSIGGYRPAGFVWNALMKGYRLGFQSSSDHYSTHISYALVYAEEATREGILEGFKRRHCYAANDNIILDVRCGDHMMGDIFTLRGMPTLRIMAVGTAPIARVSIIRGVGADKPRYVYDVRPNKQKLNLTWTDNSPAWNTQAHYYVRIEQLPPKQGNGALAWASPMWITARQ